VNDETHLGLRLAALTLVAVIVQIAMVSEFTVFGVTADIAPLVIGTAGLLTGPVAGSLVGFSMGLLTDMLLVQTLGVSALIYTLIGFGAGRLRELRAPQATFTPLGASSRER